MHQTDPGLIGLVAHAHADWGELVAQIKDIIRSRSRGGRPQLEQVRDAQGTICAPSLTSRLKILLRCLVNAAQRLMAAGDHGRNRLRIRHSCAEAACRRTSSSRGGGSGGDSSSGGSGGSGSSSSAVNRGSPCAVAGAKGSTQAPCTAPMQVVSLAQAGPPSDGRAGHSDLRKGLHAPEARQHQGAAPPAPALQ